MAPGPDVGLSLLVDLVGLGHGGGLGAWQEAQEALPSTRAQVLLGQVQHVGHVGHVPGAKRPPGQNGQNVFET